MTREVIGFAMVMLVFAIAALIAVGYRRKSKAETNSVAPLMEAVDCSGVECMYVSTVYAESPLRRLLAHGMGPRGRASVAVTDEGISVCRNGERDYLIPKAQIQSVGKSSATIDKAVEPGGLVSIEWSHQGIDLITNLRFSDSESRKIFEGKVLA